MRPTFSAHYRNAFAEVGKGPFRTKHEATHAAMRLAQQMRDPERDDGSIALDIAVASHRDARGDLLDMTRGACRVFVRKHMPDGRMYGPVIMSQSYPGECR